MFLLILFVEASKRRFVIHIFDLLKIHYLAFNLDYFYLLVLKMTLNFIGSPLWSPILDRDVFNGIPVNSSELNMDKIGKCLKLCTPICAIVIY